MENPMKVQLRQYFLSNANVVVNEELIDAIAQVWEIKPSLARQIERGLISQLGGNND